MCPSKAHDKVMLLEEDELIELFFKCCEFIVDLERIGLLAEKVSKMTVIGFHQLRL